MKVSELWLREWVDAPVDVNAIAVKLNMAGIEAEAVPVVTEMPRGVVVGRIVNTAPHPQAIACASATSMSAAARC